MAADEQVPNNAMVFDDAAITVEKADGETCDRCHQVRKDVGVDEELPHSRGRYAKIVRDFYPETAIEGFEEK